MVVSLYMSGDLMHISLELRQNFITYSLILFIIMSMADNKKISKRGNFGYVYDCYVVTFFALDGFTDFKQNSLVTRAHLSHLFAKSE